VHFSVLEFLLDIHFAWNFLFQNFRRDVLSTKGTTISRVMGISGQMKAALSLHLRIYIK